MKAFQAKNGLAADGGNTASTREKLFKAYIRGLNDQSFPNKLFENMAGRSFQGCSEFNLLEDGKGALKKNRRVTVLLLRDTKKFLINYPCRSGNVMACRAQVKKIPDKRRKAVYTCFFYDELVKEESGRGGGEVARPTGVAKFIGITAAEIKQYVNLDPDPSCHEAGMDRRLEVEVTGLAEGADVHWTVNAGPGNSLRTEPRTGPMLNADEEPLAFKDGCATMTSKVAQGKSAIWLRCGVCGGDEFTVEVGAVSGKVDGSVKIVTWRWLEYETLHPLATGEGRLTDWTVFALDKGPGLPRKSTDYLDKVLGQGFVEFKEIHKDTFDASGLPNGGKNNIFDGSYVGKPLGTKVIVTTSDQLGDILAIKARNRANKRSVAMIWCDFLTIPTSWNQSFKHIFREDRRWTETSVFQNVIGTSAEALHGSYSLNKMTWTVTHWFDPSAQENAAWKRVVSPADPGFEFRNGGAFYDESDIKAHIKFEGIRTLGFRFPPTKAEYPGKLLKRDKNGCFVDKDRVLGLTIALSGIAGNTSFNGMALNGTIWMNTLAGKVNHIGMAGVIAHELGHNMCQAYADKNADAYFGRPEDKPIPGIPFPRPVPHGDSYGGHGHQGTHCAKGVANKSEKDFTKQESKAFSEHTCIMFGASDMTDAKEFTFCENCL